MSLLSGTHILVVDDEPTLREAIRFELEMEGATVAEASGGREALALVKTQPFDLVLSDVRMPDGDGIALLDNIKQLNFKTPVVMLITGYADLSSDQAYNKGCAGFISKPFDPEQLTRLIARAIKPPAQQWAEKLDRPEVSGNVKIELPSLAKALEDKIFNVSKGGMFVASNGPLPTEGTALRFELIWSDKRWSPLVGEGIVRWTRPTAQPKHPAGYGVEFFNLSAESIKQLTEIIEQLKNKISYIPAA